MLVEKDADYERYVQLRAVSKKLNEELTRRLQKKEIYRCGKACGAKTQSFLSGRFTIVVIDHTAKAFTTLNCPIS